jgi:hypothetical protein
MMPPVGFTSQQLAAMMAPWVIPYHCWGAACGMCWLNYCTMMGLLSSPPTTRQS